MARKLNKPTVTPPIDTGIYWIPGDRYAGVETHTPEALAAVAESIAASWKPRDIDSELKRIIGNARIGKADPREHVRKAAGDLLTSVFFLHKAIAEGNLRAVAYYGIEVGTNDEQLLVKLAHEENAMRGKRTQKGSTNGGAKTHKKATTCAEQIRRAVAERLEQQPHDSVTSAGQWVADKAATDANYQHHKKRGWSLGSIRRAIKGMKKLKTGRRKAAP